MISSTPAPSAVRLLIGAHLLVIVQACLIRCSQAPRDPVLLLLIATATITAVMALFAAVRGGSSEIPPSSAQKEGQDG